MPIIRVSIFVPALLVLGLTGCREAKITSYRAPKETLPVLPPAMTADTAAATSSAAPALTGTMAGTVVPVASGVAELKWTAPATWQSKPASSMRKATYAVVGDNGEAGDLSIVVLSGDGGGELSNLNRWRGQLQLNSDTAMEAEAEAAHFTANGLKFIVVDYANAKATPPSRLLGAIVPAGDATWFFKLTGPVALLEREKPAFLDFLKTVKAP